MDTLPDAEKSGQMRLNSRYFTFQEMRDAHQGKLLKGQNINSGTRGSRPSTPRSEPSDEEGQPECTRPKPSREKTGLVTLLASAQPCLKLGYAGTTYEPTILFALEKFRASLLDLAT